MRGLSVPVRAPFPHGHLPEPRPLPPPQREAVQRERVRRPGLPDRRLGHPERQRVVAAPEFEFSEVEDGEVAPGGFRLVPVRLGAGGLRERAVVQGELEVRGRRLGVRYLDRGGGDGGQRVHAGLRGVDDVCRVPARPRGFLAVARARYLPPDARRSRTTGILVRVAASPWTVSTGAALEVPCARAGFSPVADTAVVRRPAFIAVRLLKPIAQGHTGGAVVRLLREADRTRTKAWGQTPRGCRLTLLVPRGDLDLDEPARDGQRGDLQ